MPLRTVQIIEKHSLGVAVAKERLKKLADELKNQNSHIHLTDFQWTEITNTLTFTLDAYGTTVRGKTVITPDYVEIATEPLPPLTWLFIPFVQSSLHTKLANALK